MFKHTPPWDISPELQLERLQLLRSLVKDIHADALVDHQPKKGETNLSLGVRQYERGKEAFFVARRDVWWLGVRVENNECILSIEGIPLKFAFDDPEHPKARHASGSPLEEYVRQASFWEDPELGLPEPGLVWRLFVGPHHADGSEVTVALCESATREVKVAFLVPPPDARSLFGDAPEPTPVAPPTVVRKVDQSAAQQENSGDGS